MAILGTLNKQSIDVWFCCSNAQLLLVTDSKTKGYQSVDLSGLPTTLLLFTCTYVPKSYRKDRYNFCESQNAINSAVMTAGLNHSVYQKIFSYFSTKTKSSLGKH